MYKEASLPPHTSKGGNGRTHAGPWTLWESLLMLVLFAGVPVLVSMGMVSLVSPGLDPSAGVAQMESSLVRWVVPVTILVTHAVCWLGLLMLASTRMDGFLQTIGLKGEGKAVPWAAVVIGAVVLGLVVHTLTSFNAAPRDVISPMDRFMQTGPLSLALTFVFAVILYPLLEEVLFRGLLFSALRASSTFWATLIATSLLFAALHFKQYGGHWVSMLAVLAVGAILAWLRERFGPVLWAPIVFHATYNLAVLVLAIVTAA